MDSKKVASAIIPIVVFLALWAIPAPSGVAPKAWLLFAIFVAVIAGLILRPLPMSAVVLIGVVASALSGALTIGEALAGFADTTVWLIVSAYLFARAFLKTRLGERIAWIFIRAIGKRTLTLGYALSLTDLVIAPGTPSNTARAGGVLFPIIRSIAKAYDSEPGPTAKRIGNFLMFNEYQTTLVTGAMFMTGMAANPLLVSLAKQALKVEISWAMWFLGAIVPGFVAFFLVPLLVYFLTKPEIKESPEAPRLAEKNLKEMGPLKREEKILIFVFILALALWILSETLKINATTTALLGAALMVITGVLNWQDVIGERSAWDALVWFGGLVGMAAGLASTGKQVFAVSPACFLTARALEQIKNDVAYSDRPVKLIGISAGVSYGALGSTHHSLHDYAVLRAINNIDIVAPADNFETREVIKVAEHYSRPIYIRFGKKPMFHLHGPGAQFEIGKAIQISEGSDVVFIGTGETVAPAAQAREVLEKQAACILQPDLSHAGGILECREVAARAETYYAA
ncbi:MAG: DASS family sodium-coupled anion symporter, partial [Candidatus Bathyarchaeia archaeon]